MTAQANRNATDPAFSEGSEDEDEFSGHFTSWTTVTSAPADVYKLENHRSLYIGAVSLETGPGEYNKCFGVITRDVGLAAVKIIATGVASVITREAPYEIYCSSNQNELGWEWCLRGLMPTSNNRHGDPIPFDFMAVDYSNTKQHCNSSTAVYLGRMKLEENSPYMYGSIIWNFNENRLNCWLNVNGNIQETKQEDNFEVLCLSEF